MSTAKLLAWTKTGLVALVAVGLAARFAPDNIRAMVGLNKSA